MYLPRTSFNVCRPLIYRELGRLRNFYSTSRVLNQTAITPDNLIPGHAEPAATAEWAAYHWFAEQPEPSSSSTSDAKFPQSESDRQPSVIVPKFNKRTRLTIPPIIPNLTRLYYLPEKTFYQHIVYAYPKNRFQIGYNQRKHDLHASI